MAGTKIGGMKARDTNLRLHGADFYKKIGRTGGHNGKTGGFAANPELARRAGSIGGRKSRRGAGSIVELKIKPQAEKISELYRRGFSVPQISKELDISYSTLLKWVKEEVPEYELDKEA